MSSLQAGVKRDSTRIPFRFRALPSEVMASRTLSSTAKLLLATIIDAAKDNRSGLCKLANKTLGDRIGRSESEVGRYLAELEAAGLIRREYGKSMRVRAGIAVTWSESVPDLPATQDRESTASREPGSAKVGNPVPQGPGTSRTPVEPAVEPGISLSDDGRNPDPGNRIATPEETAAFMRSLARGGKPVLPEANPPAPQPIATTTATPSAPPVSRPSATPLTSPASIPQDLTRMFRTVGYSAVAAVARSRPPRKSADQQMDELRRRTAERELLQTVV